MSQHCTHLSRALLSTPHGCKLLITPYKRYQDPRSKSVYWKHEWSRVAHDAPGHTLQVFRLTNVQSVALNDDRGHLRAPEVAADEAGDNLRVNGHVRWAGAVSSRPRRDWNRGERQRHESRAIPHMAAIPQLNRVDISAEMAT